MNADFWHEKWQQHDIGFHELQGNALMVAHFDKLKLEKGARVFLPLCGKTLDIRWLLSCGFRVVGAELSETAIRELFEELEVVPDIASVGAVKRYSAINIDIFVGNLFDLDAGTLGPVDAVYDRAALVALPAEMRDKYTEHLMHITEAAPQLLIIFEYDQLQMDGPPFSITEKEVKMHYGAHYQLQEAERRQVEGGLKGSIAATESAWHLQK